MTDQPNPADVDAFLDTTFVGEDAALSAALEASDAAGLPRIAVSAQQGKFLSLLATAIGARRILEIGTLGGYSTIWLARGAGSDARVVTLEAEPLHAEVARANLDRAGVGDRVEVVVGPALQTLPSVNGPFDLVFIDADKENTVGYLQWAVRLSRPGSVIVVDNVIRDGSVLAPPDDDPLAKAMRAALDMMADHSQLDAAVLQTVGVKGWDGFALALVR
ncbi:O-methyltransferase [Mycobacterium sp.]|uniref:O-methyltransferase n=1 Tax=Mycobacterium sp. TaxID=1785 RepID=UPI0025D4C5D4|nr:O-methyltransferase [Mycobacterium sp.]